MSRFALFPRSHRMMTCRRVGEQLQAYLDGEIDDLTTQRIAHHLEDCRRCGMELDVYTQIKASLQRRGHDADGDALQRLRAFSQRLALVPESDPSDAGEAPSG
jgi:anti-sigma factor (TIGR02949 family)